MNGLAKILLLPMSSDADSLRNVCRFKIDSVLAKREELKWAVGEMRGFCGRRSAAEPDI